MADNAHANAGIGQIGGAAGGAPNAPGAQLGAPVGGVNPLALAPPAVYQPVAFNGTLPGAPQTSNVAAAFGALGPVQNRQNADTLFTFLSDPASNLLQLNGDKTLYAGLVIVDKRVKVIYGFGFGTAPIGQASPVEGKILAMAGEFNSTCQPSVFVIDPTIRNLQDVIAFTAQGMENALTLAGAGFRLPLGSANSQENNARVNIMQCAPIPGHMVLDGFNSDLCPVDVYERLITSTAPSIAVEHAKRFLRAAVVKFRINDLKPCIDIVTFVPPPPQGAEEWAKDRKTWFFPLVNTQHALNAAPFPPQLQGMPFAQVQQLLAMLQAQQQPVAPRPQAEEKKQDDSTGLAAYELTHTLVMCGLNETDEQHLPSWFKEIQDKKLSDHSKAMIINEAISRNTRFRDADVQCTLELLKMIKNRSWMGGDTMKRPLYGNAMKGLSPFAMLDLTEDEVADLMAADAALQAASTTTVADYKTKSTNFAKVPSSAEDFLVMLKRFANLLFALFGGACPLYLHLVNVVENIIELSKSARDVMSLRTKAAILWIILIQSREFAKGQGNLTAEFKELQHGLAVKRAEITHAEVPVQLTAPETIKKRPAADTGQSVMNSESGKKQRLGTNKVTAINPILKPITDAWLANGKPRLRDICGFCGISPNQLGTESNTCRSNLIFGACTFEEKCYLSHIRATDAEAKKIVELLGKFKDEPDGIKPRANRQRK